MDKRLKEIDNILSTLNNNKISLYLESFKDELKDYKYIESLDELYKLKSAGYIRYINLEGELKFGGILIKVFKSEDEEEFKKKNLILIQNSKNQKWVISWEKNYIFYKNQTKKGDNLRNLFISLLDEKN